MRLKFARRLLPLLFLLLTSLMVVSALIWATMFVFTQQEPRARNFAQTLTSIVNLTRVAVVAADPIRRSDLLTDLRQQEGVRIYVADENEPAAPTPEDPFLQKVLTHLRSDLGPRTQLITERNGRPGVFVRVGIEGDDYWIGLPRERLDRSRSLQWMGWGALAAVAALFAAVLFV